tara:strand:- start:43 stop:1383 length:1341 start_codon:yes stop_codon:yes gene_type:complete
MSELNLDFDTGIKNISMTNNTGDNLGFSKGNNLNIEEINTNSDLSPNLKTSDPIGVEMLANGMNDNSNSQHNSLNSSPRNDSVKSEEFSFFKSSEDKGGIIDGDLPGIKPENDTLFMSKGGEMEDHGYKPIHRLSPQEIKNEKIDLLYKFKKLEHQGIRTTMNYNMNSHLDDMRNEYIKLKKQREIDNSIKFQRKMLMACVTGLEFINGKFDPFNVKLDGWGESVNENLNDYDEIFEELGDKYGGGGEMAPEIRLLLTLAGSAFMFHLSNTMFKSSIPGMDDVLKQNPELMKQFAEAAVGSMNNGGQSQGAPQMPQPRQAPPPNPLEAMMGGGGGGNPLSGLMGGLMGGIMGGGGGGGGGNPLASMMGGGGGNPLASMMGGGDEPRARRTASPARSDMSGPDADGIDELITKMNLQPDKIPDLDNISLMSGDSDRKSGGGGITLNL